MMPLLTKKGENGKQYKNKDHNKGKKEYENAWPKKNLYTPNI